MFFARRIAGGKHKAGSVEFVFDSGGHNAHHTFVKIGIKHADCGWWCITVVEQRFGNLHGLLAHVAFNVAPFAVDGIELPGQLVCA